MEAIFLGMFLVGLSTVALSFLLGFAHADLHLMSDHLGDVSSGTHDAGNHGASPFNIGTISAFLTWFGGIGYLLTAQVRLGILPVLLLSTVGGLLGAGIVFFLLVRVLVPGQTSYMREADYRLEGTLARVSIQLDGARTGEIVYERGGTTRSEGARSADGTALPRGSEVVILRYEKGIAYVETLDKLLAERGDPSSGLPKGPERSASG